MMNIATIIGICGQLFSAYDAIKEAAKATGMDPDEFDAAVEAEFVRVNAWKAKTDAAEDDIFKDAEK